MTKIQTFLVVISLTFTGLSQGVGHFTDWDDNLLFL
jgi:hypothetical protein